MMPTDYMARWSAEYTQEQMKQIREALGKVPVGGSQYQHLTQQLRDCWTHLAILAKRAESV